MVGSKLKIVGTVLELEFAAECIRRGAIVSQPFGDNAHYDFLVDSGVNIYRVQVKAASLRPDRKYYSVNLTRRLPNRRSGDSGGSSRSVPYEAESLDCIVTKVRGVWFFFDKPHLPPANGHIYPDADLSRHKGNRGWERWDLIGLGNDAGQGETKNEDLLMGIAFDDLENV